MQIRLVPNLQLANRIIGPTTNATANQALYQRYAKRLQARLGIGFQVYVDQSNGYDLLNARNDDSTTWWVVADSVYQALTTALLAHHQVIAISDQTILLKSTQALEKQLKTANHV
ncbi:hypothetical protein [Lactiplantibacillus modestisalitolerans]|uniref:Uncharacterized protein n=1 Tax=Lactiplantibacillus modestisalitolerans TaxID=1457219 RepID=A0ABV5WWB7_9LACO|nr:hypothetical protein [Lactiplantibacillus modestisalitolerans]